MKSLKCFVYFLTLIILGNFILAGKEKVLPKAPTIKPPLPKRLPPPPIKPPPPKWSDFKYNSDEEKEFWEQVSDFKIPNHYGWVRINSKGYKIPYDPYYKGYTGYQKKIVSGTRILSKYEDGFLVQRASWYKSGKIKSKETYKDGKRFGVWNEWHENGQKESEINYKDGNREGLSVGWHEDGQKETEVNYREGKPDGLWVAWHPNGQKETEGNYKEGKPDGLWVAWYPNGQKGIEVNYKEGKPDGLQTKWHENGQQSSETNYKDGKVDGLWVVWYSSGQKSRESNYKDGKLDGLWVIWHENGQKSSETNYKDGKREGLQVAWYESGQKREESNYKDGKRDGLWVEWHEDGQKKSEINYKDGKREVYQLSEPRKLSSPYTIPKRISPPLPIRISPSVRVNFRFPDIDSTYLLLAPESQNLAKTDKLVQDDSRTLSGKIKRPPIHMRIMDSKGRFIDKISKIKRPPNLPAWSYIKYTSEEEKEFWDSVPTFGEGNFSNRRIDPRYLGGPHFMRIGLRMDSKGGSIDKNSTKIGYSGFLKFKYGFERSLAKFSNGIIETQESWDSNNQKTYELKDGVERYWHSNGQQSKETNYKDDKREGLETTWYENGQKSREFNYKDDKREGLETTWYENGQKETEGHYNVLRREGLWVEWYENGQKKSEKNYKDGKRDGLWVGWDEDGQKSYESNYKDGKKVSSMFVPKPIRKLKIPIPKKQEEQDQ